MTSQDNADLQPNTNELDAFCNALLQRTITSCQQDITWYTRNAKNKKWWASYMRIGALSLLGLGSVFPVIVDVLKTSIPASIATLLIGLGSGLIALDRFMGHSTGWMRHLTAEMLLKNRLEVFEYEVQMEKLRWTGGKPDIEQATSMVSRCASLRNEFSGIVRDETQVWVQEFQSNLKTLDENYKVLANANRPGAISLTVENGDQYAGGWDLFADNRFVGNYRGQAAAIDGLLPGFCKIIVTAKDANQKPVVTLPAIVSVVPAQLVTLALSLPKPSPDAKTNAGGTD